MPSEEDMDPKEKHVKEKIEEIEKEVEFVLDCDVIDPRTRKTLIYLIDKEIKFWKGFPRVLVEDKIYDLQQLKDKLASCKLEKKEKKVDKKTGKEKELSPYQQHMKNCMKGGKTFMECVEEWREKKTQS